jgi:hypothetical protein
VESRPGQVRGATRTDALQELERRGEQVIGRRQSGRVYIVDFQASGYRLRALGDSDWLSADGYLRLPA